LNLNRIRRLTNQDAFDAAMLTLLNQGHSCVSATGRPRYRGPRGKSAIGALIPDELYVATMEGKNVHYWLAATRGSEYEALRERLGGVTPSLLDELQDLHDRIGTCMPSLYRHLAVAGAQRIAQGFKLSMSLVHRGATYQHLRGPRFLGMISNRPIPTTARPVDVAPAPDLTVARPPVVTPAADLAAVRSADMTSAPEPALARSADVASAPELAAARFADVTSAPELAAARSAGVTSAPELTAARSADVTSAPELTAAPPAADVTPAAPELAATPTPVPQPVLVAEKSPQDDLDLIAQGIARAIAASRAHNQSR
jgi:hypothetical protein